MRLPFSGSQGRRQTAKRPGMMYIRGGGSIPARYAASVDGLAERRRTGVYDLRTHASVTGSGI